MKNLLNKFLFTILLCSAFNVFANSDTICITGVVVDYIDNEPVQFAEIYIYGAEYRTFSDNHGRFILSNIEIDNKCIVVCIQCVGYYTYMQEVDINDVKNINVKLERSAMELKDEPIKEIIMW